MSLKNTNIKMPAKKSKSVTFKVPSTKPETIKFEEEENSEENSDYSDIENDINNDDAKEIEAVVNEVKGKENIYIEKDKNENENKSNNAKDYEEEDYNEDEDYNEEEGDDEEGEEDEEDEEDEISEVSRQNEDSNLLNHKRIIKIVKKTKKENFITLNVMSRFEQASLIYNRASHLERGAPSFVNTDDQSNELGIVVKEMMSGEIPFLISRQIGSEVEWHSTSEMTLNSSIMHVLNDYH
jgi:DNA-directed RNA polymerase subunit K/omega